MGRVPIHWIKTNPVRKTPQDGPGGGHRVEPPHHVAALGQLPQVELYDHRRHHSQNEADGKEQDGGKGHNAQDDWQWSEGSRHDFYQGQDDDGEDARPQQNQAKSGAGREAVGGKPA